jgi:predicted phage terminase large subunit-like protein
MAKAKQAGLDPDLIMSGYGDTLVQAFSKDVQGIIQSQRFKVVFPKVRLSPRERSVHSWAIDGQTGRATVAGLGGGLVGKGGDLIVLDDYMKNREEARSETYRNKGWSFFQDLVSRRAPTSIVIVVATPWHVDDIRGRIKKAMDEDPDFPRFEELSFPAKVAKKNGAWDGKTFLFPERFPREWYVGQYAAQGSFAPALLDCDPVMEGGNLFDMTKIKIHDTLKDFPNATQTDAGTWTLRGYKRGWDLASATKERAKADPDFTVGVKGFVQEHLTKVKGVELRSYDIWIADVVHCRAEAPDRDALILNTVVRDGRSTSQHVEDFGAYKDAYTTLRRILSGVVVVEACHLPGDKVAKASPLEPCFQVGGVHLLRADWNDFWKRHFAQFPDGTHDDAVDGTVVMFDAFTHDKPGIASPEYFRLLAQ